MMMDFGDDEPRAILRSLFAVIAIVIAIGLVAAFGPRPVIVSSSRSNGVCHQPVEDAGCLLVTTPPTVPTAQP
jgi:hypothetical protein